MDAIHERGWQWLYGVGIFFGAYLLVYGVLVADVLFFQSRLTIFLGPDAVNILEVIYHPVIAVVEHLLN